MAKLVVFLPDGMTLDVPLTRERTTIGRRAGNDVVLPNLAVSGEHAVVVTILADSFLEDLNSTNGTLVNGEPVAKHFLRDRDAIDIGRHKLVYCVDDDADPAAEVLGVRQNDFGGTVETAKPFVKGQGAGNAATGDAPAKTNEGGSAAISPRRPRAGGDPASLVGRSQAVAPTPASSMRGQAAAGTRVRPIEPLIEPPPPAVDQTQPPIAVSARLTGPGVKVLTGARAGLVVPLSKAATTIGRPGVQVAAILHLDGRFRVKLVEGIAPPGLNGQPIGSDGADLMAGDVMEVAGTRVEFVDPRAKPVERGETPEPDRPAKG